jgi:hypothetical protein
MNKYELAKYTAFQGFLFFSMGVIVMGQFNLQLMRFDGPKEATLVNLSLIREVALGNAVQHEFNSFSYNCVNYSADVQELLLEKNITLRSVKYCNETSCHRALKIDFEPQTGQFVDYSKQYPKQVIQ